jgi:hypothetical protein
MHGNNIIGTKSVGSTSVQEHREKPRAGIFKQSMGARNPGGIGLSYRLHRLADLISWNRFLGSLNV